MMRSIMLDGIHVEGDIFRDEHVPDEMMVTMVTVHSVGDEYHGDSSVGDGESDGNHGDNSE